MQIKTEIRTEKSAREQKYSTPINFCSKNKQNVEKSMISIFCVWICVLNSESPLKRAVRLFSHPLHWRDASNWNSMKVTERNFIEWMKQQKEFLLEKIPFLGRKVCESEKRVSKLHLVHVYSETIWNFLTKLFRAFNLSQIVFNSQFAPNVISTYTQKEFWCSFLFVSIK